MTILSLASFSAICGGGLFRETYRASNALNSTVKTETQLQEALDKIAYLENRELERRQMEVDRRRTTLEEASFNHSNNFSPSGSQHYSFDESHFEKLSPLSGDGSSFSEEEDLENLSVQSLPTIGSQHQQQNQRTHHSSATSLDLHLHAFEDGNEREFVAEVETLGKVSVLGGVRSDWEKRDELEMQGRRPRSSLPTPRRKSRKGNNTRVGSSRDLVQKKETRNTE